MSNAPFEGNHNKHLSLLTPGNIFFSCNSFCAFKAASREQNVRNAQPKNKKKILFSQLLQKSISTNKQQKITLVIPC